MWDEWICLNGWDVRDGFAGEARHDWYSSPLTHSRGSLGGNNIGEGGARALADALAKNTALKELE